MFFLGMVLAAAVVLGFGVALLLWFIVVDSESGESRDSFMAWAVILTLISAIASMFLGATIREHCLIPDEKTKVVKIAGVKYKCERIDAPKPKVVKTRR